MRHQASGQPRPQDRPGAGFAHKANAPTNDPYNLYNRTVAQDDQIWQALMTESGRQALGAQMAIPIRSELDYQGVARRFFGFEEPPLVIVVN